MEIERKKEIVDGHEIETITQLVCSNCKRIQARCKCDKPDYKPVTSVYKRPIAAHEAENANSAEGLSPEESKRRYDEKMAARAAKQQKSDESMRVANLTDEDLQKEHNDDAKSAEVEAFEAERAREAAMNVDEIVELKKSLKAEGKSKTEIKAAVSELKDQQAKRGRPAKDAVMNPVKNPVTGEFESSED